MKIKLITYNIRSGKGRDGLRDYQRIGAYLKELNVDVALLQEVGTRCRERETSQDIADLQTDHFRHIAVAPTLLDEACWYGNAILSRFPITKNSIVDISAFGREPRNILEVFIETPKGSLHVMNTHKGLGMRERSGQMRKLISLLSKNSNLPLVLGGDINEWQNLSSSMRLLNRTLQPQKSSPTFPTGLPFLRLDRIWCRPLHLIQSVKVLRNNKTKIFSDHYPLLAEILLK